MQFTIVGRSDTLGSLFRHTWRLAMHEFKEGLTKWMKFRVTLILGVLTK